MLALISPNENNRICQVEATDFPVAEPLFWVDLPNGVDQTWSYVDGQFIAPQPTPEPMVVPPTKEELLAQLQELTSKIEALTNV